MTFSLPPSFPSIRSYQSLASHLYSLPLSLLLLLYLEISVFCVNSSISSSNHVLSLLKINLIFLLHKVKSYFTVELIVLFLLNSFPNFEFNLYLLFIHFHFLKVFFCFIYIYYVYHDFSVSCL